MFLFLAFPAVFLGSESFFYRDMGLFSYPIAHAHREAFWRGEIPLWNSLSNCGIPFLAQWNTLVLYPGSLVYLILPLPWSMNLFLFAHLFFAAAGMYALARAWTQDRFAASVAGLLFAWNGFTLHALMWPAIIAALAWMPWAVLALQRAWNEGGARRIVLAALAASMQMLTGAAEIILLTWMFAGLFCLRDFCNTRSGSSPQSRWRLFLRLGICGVSVALICSAQLLPFLELLRNSQR